MAYCLERWLRDSIFTLIFGGVLGLSVATAAWVFLPVVIMQAEVVARDTDSATIHMWGRKLRDCEYIDIHTYTTSKGLMLDTRNTRIDMPAGRNSKPKGNFDIGNWLVSPVRKNAESIVVYAQHSCGPGDIRLTKIAEVAL